MMLRSPRRGIDITVLPRPNDHGHDRRIVEAARTPSHCKARVKRRLSSCGRRLLRPNGASGARIPARHKSGDIARHLRVCSDARLMDGMGPTKLRRARGQHRRVVFDSWSNSARMGQRCSWTCSRKLNRGNRHFSSPMRSSRCVRARHASAISARASARVGHRRSQISAPS